MRILISSLLLVLVLTGCSLFSVPKYDPVEYGHVAEFVQMTRVAQTDCVNNENMPSAINLLSSKAEMLETYATYRPNQKELKEVMTLIKNNLREFKTAYEAKTPPSIAYCHGKLTIVELSLTKLLSVMGGFQE